MRKHSDKGEKHNCFHSLLRRTVFDRVEAARHQKRYELRFLPSFGVFCFLYFPRWRVQRPWTLVRKRRLAVALLGLGVWKSRHLTWALTKDQPGTPKEYRGCGEVLERS